MSCFDGWAGRTVNLNEVPVRGNGQILMTDAQTGDTLYRQSFSTLFQEWQTTEEATKVRKSFENVFLLPYDYDNTLGTSNAYDAAKQDPYNWGDKGLLMERMMKFEEFRNIYRDELKRLVNPAYGLMNPAAATQRILDWQAKIKDFISNDTDEDMEIKDRPASWGKIGDYRLMSSSNNYFTVKAETINKLQ